MTERTCSWCLIRPAIEGASVCDVCLERRRRKSKGRLVPLGLHTFLLVTPEVRRAIRRHRLRMALRLVLWPVRAVVVAFRSVAARIRGFVRRG